MKVHTMRSVLLLVGLNSHFVAGVSGEAVGVVRAVPDIVVGVLEALGVAVQVSRAWWDWRVAASHVASARDVLGMTVGTDVVPAVRGARRRIVRLVQITATRADRGSIGMFTSETGKGDIVVLGMGNCGRHNGAFTTRSGGARVGARSVSRGAASVAASMVMGAAVVGAVGGLERRLLGDVTQSEPKEG